MPLIWFIGVFFADGLLDPHNKKGFFFTVKLLFLWPWMVGAYFAKQFEVTNHGIPVDITRHEPQQTGDKNAKD